MINWIKKKIYESRCTPWSIQFDDEKITLIKNGKYDSQIRWDNVDRIHAFKNDKFTYDPIVIVLENYDKTISISYEELWPGYNEFLHMILSRWPEIGHEWISEINKGAFVPNHTLLWERTTA